jgi:YHS domain-containing protein
MPILPLTLLKRLSGLPLALFTIGAFAAEPPVQTPPLTASAAGGQPINSICPVSGDTVGSVGKPVYGDYHGKTIALCCKDCARQFRKHPDRYGSLAEKNQTAHEPR